MKAVIITCFESNEERADLIYQVCRQKGFDSVVLTSDFSHMHKCKRAFVPDPFQAVKTRPYSRNLSIKRILSHRRFAKDVFTETEKYRPDLIWLMAPANLLIKEAKRYTSRYPETRLVVDMIDMWPESLPLQISKDLFPFRIWKNIRRNSLNCADLLVTECDLYQEILKSEYSNKIKTLYWAKKMNSSFSSSLKEESGKLTLCYIGSINNLIDIDLIVSMISVIHEPVSIHVIGDGEKRDEFISRLKNVAETYYHGLIRDEEKKAQIFAKCHAGINLYKEGLYIGLTVKCIDYFAYGLPIINNIKGDTWKLVEDHHVGFNVRQNTVLDAGDIRLARRRSKDIRKLFLKSFSSEAFAIRCSELIDEVIK